MCAARRTGQLSVCLSVCLPVCQISGQFHGGAARGVLREEGRPPTAPAKCALVGPPDPQRERSFAIVKSR